MRLSTSILCLLAIAAVACGEPGQAQFGLGDTRALITGKGDQINPALDGTLLAWFDLNADADGQCYGRTEDGGWDDSCWGQLRVMDLSTGVQQAASELAEGELLPVVSGGKVVWRCAEEQQQGLCVAGPGLERDFLPELGWSTYGYYDQGKPPVVDAGRVFWVVYDYEVGGYAIMVGEIDSGEKHKLVHLDDYPAEIAAFGGYVAWVFGRYEDGQTRYRLQLMDPDSGATTGAAEADEPIFGLGGAGDWLAWKQGWSDTSAEEPGLHVYLRRPDGTVERVDSDQAWVSSETPVAVGDDSLLWIDYRRGPYAVALWRDGEESERLLSSEEALIGAGMRLAVSRNYLVWSDRQLGDWDLVLHRL